MDDGVFPPDTMLENILDTTMDFDLMDELLLGECWLETPEGFDFLQPGPSTSSALFDSSYILPTSEINSGCSNPNPLQKDNHEERERSVIPENSPSVDPQTENRVGTQSLNRNSVEISECSGQSDSYPVESSELSRRWWIGPGVSTTKEKLMQALGYIKESTKERDVLIQIWVPTKRRGKNVLTTNNQPYSLDPNCQRLVDYRNVSTNYQFPAEEDSKELFGLPGRVFLRKVPEWTPNVRFFSSDEYPRIDYARRYDVRGTLALPVFGQGSRTCLGVIEVVLTTEKINYRSELENVCKALEAVDLRSSEVLSAPEVKLCNNSYQAALPEIREVLRSICETHKFPLAQTWVPCIQQGKRGCQHSDENYAYCVSTVDSACYVTDTHIRRFHEACSEHHLFRGQGVTGRAFTTNLPCFSNDITAFSKTEYPLSHYARMFRLHAAVAIRLRSIYTESADYVLEFFLPVDCRDTEEKRQMLNSLSLTIQRVCQSLRVITDKELEQETVFSVREVVVPSYGRPRSEEIPNAEPTPSKGSSQEESSWISRIVETQRKGKGVPFDYQKIEPTEEFKVTTLLDNPEAVFHHGNIFSEFSKLHQESGPKGSAECGGDFSSLGGCSFSSVGKGEKRRTKMEKTISLQVLRRHFAGSLKDAAKNIGVCPTTLKRICRQHGITRWPSRKIKKVGHSLRKLQVVIDSVQGAEGAFQIGSFYASFPELASPNLSGTGPISTSLLSDHPNPSNTQTETVTFSHQAAASKSPSSSCSQSSSSSLCCSSGMQQHPHDAHFACNENALMEENPGGVLKRARSDAELQASRQEEPMLLARSQSHKSLGEYPSLESLPSLPKIQSRVTRDAGALRVKTTYQEKKIRFSMQQNWSFGDLQQEIARRFNIEDMGIIVLKYLDDDSEWVLLTCDADLEECIDIYKLSRSHTIKLSVNQASNPKLVGSLGSRGLS
ncbi:hypothetical protein HHK36_008799 [Tetracentron sinense]|uniref:Uncharacterized protein n=1 Tax=Tetracentron sinense TaxID=13715 RepID=A0A834ZHE9_TETSI|nr:hypothetical protein HHK36_008799 [Tetracentron sinense]